MYEITVKAKESYLIRQPVPQTFVHKTGPCVELKTEVTRLLLVIHGHFPGDPTMSEHDQLKKKSCLSHLYHFRYEDQGVERDAPLESRKIKIVEKDAQVRAEGLIDTESTLVPAIPHGPLSEKTFNSLQVQIAGLRRQGVLLFTGITGTGSGMENETQENKRNLEEALANLMKYPLLTSEPVPINNFMKTQNNQNNAEKPTIRGKWNKISRAMGTDLGVPDAEHFEVFSVHLVDDAALRSHNDRLGLGQSVYVTVLNTNDAYKVLFAAVKQGDCSEVSLRLYGDDDDPGVYISITWA